MKRMSGLIAVIFLGLPACAGSASSNSAPAATPSLPQALQDDDGTLHYEVPVTKPELQPYASFVIKDFTHKVSAQGLTHLAYTLPQELTGRVVKVEFDGTAGQLSGPNGTMTCVQLDCKVKFKDLAINPADVAKYLSSLNLKPNELGLRGEVSASFSGDPGGILRYVELP